MVIKREYLILGVIVGGVAVAVAVHMLRARRVAAQQQPSQPSQPPQPSPPQPQPPSQQPNGTSLLLSVPSTVYVGKPFVATAQLTSGGSPVPNATIEFYVDNSKVGEAVTDSSGVARLTITIGSTGSHTICAKFAGTSGYMPSQACTAVTATFEASYLSIKTPEMYFTIQGMHPRTVYLTNVDYSKKIEVQVVNTALKEVCLDINGTKCCCPAAQGLGGGGVIQGSSTKCSIDPSDVVKITPQFTLASNFEFVEVALTVPMGRGVARYHWVCTDESGYPMNCGVAPVIKLVIDQYT